MRSLNLSFMTNALVTCFWLDEVEANIFDSVHFRNKLKVHKEV